MDSVELPPPQKHPERVETGRDPMGIQRPQCLFSVPGLESIGGRRKKTGSPDRTVMARREVEALGGLLLELQPKGLALHVTGQPWIVENNAHPEERSDYSKNDKTLPPTSPPETRKHTRSMARLGHFGQAKCWPGPEIGPES
jgi:hypothetical protein